MAYQTLLYEKKGDLGVITLNRPAELNAVNDQMLHDLDGVLIDIEHDIEVKCVLFKGAGGNFSTGQDLTGKGTDEILPDPKKIGDVEHLMELERRRNRRWEFIVNFPRPTVAQIDGYCLGAGLWLAMCCDIAISADDAVIGDPGLRMGIVTPLPLWNFMMGLKKGKEVLYLGRNLTGREAEDLNLVNRAVPRSALEQEVGRYVEAILQGPGDGLVIAKEAVNANLEMQGMGAAFRYSTAIQMLNALRQRAGLRPEQFNFFEARDKLGLKKAVEMRDTPYKAFVK